MTFPKNAHLKSPCIKPSIKPGIIELLKTHGPMTTTLLANRLGCEPKSCGLVLRSNPQEFHVADWTKSRQQIWAYGQGENAPRPPARKTKEDPAYARQLKQTEAVRDRQRLVSSYVTSERVWGI